jgi:hypothetical protein
VELEHSVDHFIRPESLQRLAPREPTPVHPPELKSESSTGPGGGISGDAPGLAETFRHSGWHRRRQLIFDALHRTGQSRTRLEAFQECGCRAYIYRTVDPPHKYRLAGSSCRDKLCSPCAGDRSRCIATNVLNRMAGKPARFITLTLKHCTDPLAEQVGRLQKAFARLRTSQVWRRHVIGGAAFVEVKWIEESASWHPHFHVICEGSYFPRQELSAAWLKITGDSWITDIRFVKDDGKISRYVCKYASKPVNDTFIGRPDRLDEVVATFRGRRLCHTFGTWRGLKLTESPCERDWVSIGSFHDVALAALAGDVESMEAIEAVCRERTSNVLAAVEFARPPPVAQEPVASQLTFAWPAIDNRT